MNKPMNKLLLAAVCIAGAAQAASSANEILDKKNRVLAPPPKSLRADNADLGYRYTSEAKRTQVVAPVPTSKARSIAASDDLPVQPVESYLSPPTEQRAQIRENRRDQKLSKYGFTGERTFGLGFVGAGVYGVFGAELDFAINESWSMGFGIGTGMAYSTWGAQGRYYFNQGKISTFAQFGFANWRLGRVPDSQTSIAPHHLVERFFYGQGETPKYRSANLVYPGIGVLYQHSSGLALSAQIDYLIHMRDFEGGLTAGLGFYYYF